MNQSNESPDFVVYTSVEPSIETKSSIVMTSYSQQSAHSHNVNNNDTTFNKSPTVSQSNFEQKSLRSNNPPTLSKKEEINRQIQFYEEIKIVDALKHPKICIQFRPKNIHNFNQGAELVFYSVKQTGEVTEANCTFLSPTELEKEMMWVLAPPMWDYERLMLGLRGNKHKQPFAYSKVFKQRNTSTAKGLPHHQVTLVANLSKFPSIKVKWHTDSLDVSDAYLAVFFASSIDCLSPLSQHVPLSPDRPSIVKITQKFDLSEKLDIRLIQGGVSIGETEAFSAQQRTTAHSANSLDIFGKPRKKLEFTTSLPNNPYERHPKYQEIIRASLDLHALYSHNIIKMEWGTNLNAHVAHLFCLDGQSLTETLFSNENSPGKFVAPLKCPADTLAGYFIIFLKSSALTIGLTNAFLLPVTLRIPKMLLPVELDLVQNWVSHTTRIVVSSENQKKNQQSDSREPANQYFIYCHNCFEEKNEATENPLLHNEENDQLIDTEGKNNNDNYIQREVFTKGKNNNDNNNNIQLNYCEPNNKNDNIQLFYSEGKNNDDDNINNIQLNYCEVNNKSDDNIQLFYSEGKNNNNDDDNDVQLNYCEGKNNNNNNIQLNYCEGKNKNDDNIQLFYSEGKNNNNDDDNDVQLNYCEGKNNNNDDDNDVQLNYCEGKNPENDQTLIENWDHEQVSNWMQECKLSRDYSQEPFVRFLSGKKLIGGLKSKDEWKKLGIPALGDCVRLAKATTLLCKNYEKQM